MELAPANDRGFLKGSFKDHNGEACSIQKSSLVDPDCIWLGCEHETVHATFGLSCGARMHLTRKMVADLLPLLQHFVDTGELPAQGEPMPKLIVIYDPADRIGFDAEFNRLAGIKEAALSIKGNMEDRDIYTLARKLAEFLLEQL